MQLVRSGLVHKTNTTLSSVVKNTSCNHGWLRVFVQYFFGAITVTSFILIVILSIGNNKIRVPAARCKLHGCRIRCTGAPYYERHEDDIIYAVSETEINCDRVLLTLNEPRFINGTLPPKWLSRMRSQIHELEIIGGNLINISPMAFMTFFTCSIRRLSLEYITITEWVPEMLVGLSDLEELNIQSSIIRRIERNALEAVDDTLRTLSITRSGRWDPVNLTGHANLEALTHVVFSTNIFNDVLQRRSFERLKHCKVLFLNSCRINALGVGTFDHLPEIEMIYLNNNYLVTMPPGLFDNVMAITNPRPRINLQDNLWLCNCSNNDLRRLTTEGVLLLEPTCFYPQAMRGKTFSKFVNYCNNNSNIVNYSNLITDATTENEAVKHTTEFHVDENCRSKSVSSNQTTLISPVKLLSCPKYLYRSINHYTTSRSHIIDKPQFNNILQAVFALKGKFYSMLQITSTGESGYGLMWFQEQCPHEVYCINELPTLLRVYNVNGNAEYTFCPVTLSTGEVIDEKCVSYSFIDNILKITSIGRIIWYFCTVIFCLLVGALCVYGIIRKFPYLLKGSNRILFVKHKNVDALILPPKVPLRSSIVNDVPVINFDNKDIFVLPENNNGFSKCPQFQRTKSTRSNKSTAPSYISALQPTEEQLTEWRLRHHFNNDLTISSVAFDFSYSPATDDESMYCSLSGASNKTNESLK